MTYYMRNEIHSDAHPTPGDLSLKTRYHCLQHSIDSFHRIACGWYGGIAVSRILYSSDNALISRFTNSVSSSVNNTRSALHLNITRLSTASLIFFPVVLRRGQHSTHFVKRSCNTRIYALSALLGENGSIISGRDHRPRRLYYPMEPAAPFSSFGIHHISLRNLPHLETFATRNIYSRFSDKFSPLPNDLTWMYRGLLLKLPGANCSALPKWSPLTDYYFDRHG